jgi:hypothetical protein
MKRNAAGYISIRLTLCSFFNNKSTYPHSYSLVLSVVHITTELRFIVGAVSSLNWHMEIRNRIQLSVNAFLNKGMLVTLLITPVSSSR